MIKDEIEVILREFRRTAERVPADNPNMKLQDVVCIYDNIESSFLSKLANYPNLGTEIKRGIAELKLDFYIERGCPFEEVYSLYRTICELGFYNIEEEAKVGIRFARYCSRNKNFEKAKEVLENLRNELDKALAIEDLEVYRSLKNTVKEMLQGKKPGTFNKRHIGNKAKYSVRAKLLSAHTKRPMVGFTVITETGIRDESSPLCTTHFGPLARTDESGGFISTFYTHASSIPIKIEVHIEFSPGSWRSRIVHVEANNVRADEEGTICVDLGHLEVDYEMRPMPTGT